MAASYILIRPPQLPELGDPSDAFIVGYDPTTDKTVKIKVANIGGGSVSPPLDISWKSNIEYSSGEIVEYGLRLWKSLQGINEGNFPTEGIWWTEVARGNQSITYWTAGVYTQDPTIKLVNDIFYRLDAALPFESVNFTNELASGDWVAIGGGGSGGGHVFEDQSGTALPARNVAKAGAGIEFEDDEVGEKTVIRVHEDLTDHIDGADEEKHTFNQVAISENKVLLGGELGRGTEGDTVDVYAISAANKTFLETENNWIVLGEPSANINAGFGIQGNRYSTVNWSYECYADGLWLRTPTGVAYLDVYNAVTAEAKLLIENTANWTSKDYTGPAITGVKKGARHYDNDYLFEFVDDNLPIRVSRV